MMKRHGFTLIELLIVIVIMGILATLITTNLFGARERAGDNQKKTNLNQLKIALLSYYVSYRTYPPNGNPVGFAFNACGVGGTNSCASSTSLTADGREYLSKIPKNSGGQYEFRYYQCNGGDDFRLKINLTNASDPDIADSQTRCPAASCLGTTLSFGPTDYVVCGN
jgi:prepilin-type N-terminal cleavage/methylation domain-containing protein